MNETQMPEPTELKLAFHPGPGWRRLRWLAQSFAFVAVLLAPFLGGWQRLDRSRLASWDGLGWDLPRGLMERLPTGEPAARAHAANAILGGGTSVNYLGLEVIDPVAGVVVLAQGVPSSLWAVIAWLLPIALGLFAGRVFCGWFCPFGTLTRGLESALRRWAPQWPRYELPRRRRTRFVFLGLAIVLGTTTSQAVLYLLLPHALLQQSAYGVLLMGGGGAALGALAGLVLVGLVFGPSVYCATVCPTGTALAALGRTRIVRLQVLQPVRCGQSCDLCDRGCWLDLRPSAGDPGPDCDLCARCSDLCPHANLEIGIARRGRPNARAALSAVGLIGLLGAGCGPTRDWREDPALVLASETSTEEVELHVAMVDMDGVRPDPDHPERHQGAEVSVFAVRGARGEPNEFGRLEARDVYLGPLRIRVFDERGRLVVEEELERPNYPKSVGWRTIYRISIAEVPKPGSRVEVDPLPGWTTKTTSLVVPSPNRSNDWWRSLLWFFLAACAFSGLAMVALALDRATDPR